MATYLTTKRIELRELTMEDAGHLADLDSDPEVMRYISDGRPSDPEEPLRYLPGIIRRYSEQPGLGLWAAIERQSGTFVGWFHFRPGDDEAGGLDLGYRLKRSVWGQGYATEVARELTRRGFEEMRIDRVFARTMAANIGSRRVMEKVGLRLVSEYLETRFPGKDKSAVVYAVTAREYFARVRSGA